MTYLKSILFPFSFSFFLDDLQTNNKSKQENNLNLIYCNLLSYLFFSQKLTCDKAEVNDKIRDKDIDDYFFLQERKK